MSRRQVLDEPEFGNTLEVEHSGEDEHEEDDDESLDAPLGAVGGGNPRRGLGRKKGGVNKKKEPENKFKADDDADKAYWTDGLNDVLKGLETVAEGYFPGVTGSEHKAERKENLKKFHDLSVEVVKTRMKLEQAPGVVQKVYDNLDLDKVAGEEEDDEVFCAMLDEYEEAAMAEIDKLEEKVQYEDVAEDTNYNECLEVLNKYQKIKGRKSIGEAQASTTREDADVPTDTGGYSEGLEALTEYIPTHDPVTRRVIVNAVVNRKCSHVYDNESIREFLMEVGGFAKKCPYAGCRQTVHEADLMVDEEMKRKVKQRIREEGLE